MYMSHTKTDSKYDEFHNAFGHLGKFGMNWHNEKTLNAQLTSEGKIKIRPFCEGCVYGIKKSQ